jgi:hypothetical protein
MDYKTWLSKHKGMKSSTQSAEKFYEATGRDAPAPVAQRIDANNRKQEFGQWRSAQKNPNEQKSNWWSGMKFRAEKGLDPTEMQAKARDKYVKKQSSRGYPGTTGRPS